MSIINFTVRHDQFASRTDGDDLGVDSDLVPLIGEIVFVPVTSDNRSVMAPDFDPRPAGVKLRPISGVVDSDGQLKRSNNGAVGVRLPANDPVLELDELWYRVDFHLHTPGGERIKIDSGHLQAPSTDQIVNLADALESTGSVSVANPLTAQRASDVLSAAAPGIVDADLAARDIGFEDAGGGAVQFTLGGDPLGDPVVIPSATWSAIAGRPAVIAAGSAKPSARAQISPGGADFLGTPSLIQYSNYTASAGDFVRCDASAPFTVTLPSAPEHGATVTVKKIDSSGNQITVVCGPSDVINYPVIGPRSYALSKQSQTVSFRYHGGAVNDFRAGVWCVVSDAVDTQAFNNSDVERLIDRMEVKPDSVRRTLISNLITDLQVAGVWDKLDGLYVFAAHDRQAARLNWVGGGNPLPPSNSGRFDVWKPATMRDCTEVNAPAFTVDRGFQGDGRAAYLDTNTLGIELSRYAPTNCAAGVYARTSHKGTVYDLASTSLIVNPSDSSDRTVIVPQAGQFFYGSNGGDTTGLFGFSRVGATATIYKDGQALPFTSGDGTVTVPRDNSNTGIYFLRRQFSTYSPRQISAGFMGSALSADQWIDLNTSLSIYLTAIGAAV